ncbi:RimJ/RimL family protein N-acetyltransferase [Paenibacillus rhizosphaerae]|uniref:RimJ/RimL family protein N-acetyltransferase n=1 Tax=Paenibacillus rhizosphaerae TaxID=297318 RepID=A0A839TXK4_9BACL|nr:GNAT family protein [Paenibacillus rhizosphaerae]MBB3131211.1 RimJ/RimL family protein N-acetyltransferase [Paenibacillus rhizosphaerae]
MREIDYSHDLWQDDEVRLRAIQPEDWESSYIGLFDTPARLLLECAIGGINLNSIDERNGTFSIGIVIDKEHRGKGYGTRAMEILSKYAFLERRLHKFNDCVLEGNEGSSRMMQKLGCVQEGVRRQVVYINGKYMDFIQKQNEKLNL